MKVKIKKLVPEAVIPSYSKEGDCGLDLTAVSFKRENLYVEYGTGLSVEIPDGFTGLVFPRSSISNTNLVLANSVGIIDSKYRGEIKCRFKTNDKSLRGEYSLGDRIAQLIILPYPTIEFEEVEELSTSERSTAGFGSTGN